MKSFTFKIGTAGDAKAAIQTLLGQKPDMSFGPKTDAALNQLEVTANDDPWEPAAYDAATIVGSPLDWNAALAKVPGRGSAPVEFLDELVTVISGLPDEVFAENKNDDIYGRLAAKLGPYTSMAHRRAVMAEGLRVVAGFESGWNWNEGVDMEPGAGTGRPKSEWETGAFQVSPNSMTFYTGLADCVRRLAGATDNDTFLSAMKSNHALAVEYCARLFRYNTTWEGPMDRGEVASAVSRDSVAEFEAYFMK